MAENVMEELDLAQIASHLENRMHIHESTDKTSYNIGSKMHFIPLSYCRFNYCFVCIYRQYNLQFVCSIHNWQTCFTDCNLSTHFIRIRPIIRSENILKRFDIVMFTFNIHLKCVFDVKTALP